MTSTIARTRPQRESRQLDADRVDAHARGGQLVFAGSTVDDLGLAALPDDRGAVSAPPLLELGPGLGDQRQTQAGPGGPAGPLRYRDRRDAGRVVGGVHDGGQTLAPLGVEYVQTLRIEFDSRAAGTVDDGEGFRCRLGNSIFLLFGLISHQ